MFLNWYVVRRLLISLFVVLVTTVAAFAALSAAPGDPITARVDSDVLARLSTEQLDSLREQLGLDKPVPIQYLIWLRGAVGGDLGYSVVGHSSVGDEIVRRIGPTVILMGVSFAIGITLAIVMGIAAAVRQYSVLDYIIAGFSSTFVSVPGFVVGLILIYLLGVQFDLFPVHGMATPGEPFSVTDRLQHLVMPVSVLALRIAAPIVRYTRASMLEVLQADYVMAATAKGLKRSIVLRRHALRNALIPVVTVAGLALPNLIAGAVIIETLFGYPGMGQLVARAASDRDTVMMMGVILVVGIGVALSNLITDLLYGLADPRIQLGGRA